MSDKRLGQDPTSLVEAVNKAGKLTAPNSPHPDPTVLATVAKKAGQLACVRRVGSRPELLSACEPAEYNQE